MNQNNSNFKTMNINFLNLNSMKTSKFFIENTRVHAGMIMKAITQNSVMDNG